MLIAYLTHDEVNLEAALQMADAYGATVYPLVVSDATPKNWFDALIYDIDHLPPEDRRKLIDQLLAAPPNFPVVVHSYNLSDEQVRTLKGAGIIVTRSLEPEMFKVIHRAAARNRLNAINIFRQSVVVARPVLRPGAA